MTSSNSLQERTEAEKLDRLWNLAYGPFVSPNDISYEAQVARQKALIDYENIAGPLIAASRRAERMTVEDYFRKIDCRSFGLGRY